MAEFAKQMLHMPGVVRSSPPLAADAFQMAKADDDFHIKCLHCTCPGLPRVALRLANPFHSPPSFARMGSNSCWQNSSLSIFKNALI
jgi:hypothetical protein